MVALYWDGEPTLGYIMDVMNKRLYHAWRFHIRLVMMYLQLNDVK